MTHFVSNDLAADYRGILLKTREWGEPVAPRGKPTRELLGMTLELRDPTRALVTGTNRKIHLGVAAAEALQLVGGFSDPAAMQQVSPHFSQFQDGGVFHASYGVRANPQVPQAIARLRADSDSRQAVIALWDPTQDLWTTGSRDYPCTTHLQLMIRRGKLDLHCSMRANDAWRGFPYDVFQFTQLQCSVANLLMIDPGTYYHHATSFHLYEENLEAVSDLVQAESQPVTGVEATTGLWSETQFRARGLFYGTAIPLSQGEDRMSNALRKVGVTGAW